MDKIEFIKSNLSIAKLLSILNLQANPAGFIKSIYKSEKTPSLKIYYDTNSFYCFATSQGGDVIKLYKDFYKLTDKDAINELYEICNGNNTFMSNGKEIKLEEAKSTESENKENVYDCLTPDEKYIYDETTALSNEDNALKEVIRFRLDNNKKIFNYLYDYCKKYIAHSFQYYLINQRKINLESILKYKIFYIENYFEVNSKLKNTFKMYELIASGLYNDRGNLIFAKHKIVIPYLYNNEIVYLRGRYFYDANPDCKDCAKYIGLKNDLLNVNTTKRLYNADVFNQVVNGDRLFITEGEFDAIVLSQAGFYAVAIPGVGNIPSDKWIRKMQGLRVCVIVDNDDAGETLREKLNEKLLTQNIKVVNYYIKDFKDVTDLAINIGG